MWLELWIDSFWTSFCQDWSCLLPNEFELDRRQHVNSNTKLSRSSSGLLRGQKAMNEGVYALSVIDCETLPIAFLSNAPARCSQTKSFGFDLQNSRYNLLVRCLSPDACLHSRPSISIGVIMDHIIGSCITSSFSPLPAILLRRAKNFQASNVGDSYPPTPSP
jgi:hypothetical protein